MNRSVVDLSRPCPSTSVDLPCGLVQGFPDGAGVKFCGQCGFSLTHAYHRGLGSIEINRMRPATHIVLIAALLAVALFAAPTQAAEAQRLLVMGRVSDDPRAHYGAVKPMLDYMVERLRPLGITGGEVLMARDANQMVSYLRQGKVDWVAETPGAALHLVDQAEARILLAAWRGGLASYHSLVVVRSDSPIEQLADLDGRHIAFQHPNSTSGYLVPAALMLGSGLNLALLGSPADRPIVGIAGYSFARSESNQVAWLRNGLVDALAFSTQDWQLLVEEPGIDDEFRVIARTEPIPRALELVRVDLDPMLADALERTLLEANDDPAAASALQAYYRTDRFVQLSEDDLARLASLREGLKRVRSEVE